MRFAPIAANVKQPLDPSQHTIAASCSGVEAAAASRRAMANHMRQAPLAPPLVVEHVLGHPKRRQLRRDTPQPLCEHGKRPTGLEKFSEGWLHSHVRGMPQFLVINRLASNASPKGLLCLQRQP
jgi:hypothetical protein